MKKYSENPGPKASFLGLNIFQAFFWLHLVHDTPFKNKNKNNKSFIFVTRLLRFSFITVVGVT
jgi:hypothetical protein